MIAAKRDLNACEIIARFERRLRADPPALVERLSEQLLKKLGKVEPPFQTEKFEYASLVGAKVIPTEITFDGLMSVFNRRITIEVNRHRTFERQNFTVCHEVAHVQIRRGTGLLPTQRKMQSSPDFAVRMPSSNLEERMAQAMAANLLMPKKDFVRRASELEPSIENAISLAKTYKASLGATLRRAVSLCAWKCVIIWCTPEKMLHGHWGVNIHELKSAYLHGPSRPSHGYVRWGGDAARETLISPGVVEKIVPIDGEDWSFQGLREWYFATDGRENRVMAILRPMPLTRR